MPYPILSRKDGIKLPRGYALIPLYDGSKALKQFYQDHSPDDDGVLKTVFRKGHSGLLYGLFVELPNDAKGEIISYYEFYPGGRYLAAGKADWGFFVRNSRPAMISELWPAVERSLSDLGLVLFPWLDAEPMQRRLRKARFNEGH